MELGETGSDRTHYNMNHLSSYVYHSVRLKILKLLGSGFDDALQVVMVPTNVCNYASIVIHNTQMHALCSLQHRILSEGIF